MSGAAPPAWVHQLDKEIEDAQALCKAAGWPS